MTPSEFERCLTASNWMVRRTFASPPYILTPTQFSRGLQDTDPSVRLAYFKRDDMPLSSAQALSGLVDPSHRIRAAVIERTDFLPTPKQVEQLLQDPEDSVRAALILKQNIHFTPEQINICLQEKSTFVLSSFLQRKDFKLTPTQQQPFFEPTSTFTPITLYNLLERPETQIDSSRLEFLLNHSNALIRTYVCRLENFLPTKEQLERGLRDPDPFLRSFFAKNNEQWSLQIEAKSLRKTFKATDTKKQTKTL